MSYLGDRDQLAYLSALQKQAMDHLLHHEQRMRPQHMVAQALSYGNNLPDPFDTMLRREEQPARKRYGCKFWRINEHIQQEEGTNIVEPLDELRLRISRWLKQN